MVENVAAKLLEARKIRKHIRRIIDEEYPTTRRIDAMELWTRLQDQRDENDKKGRGDLNWGLGVAMNIAEKMMRDENEKAKEIGKS